MKNLIKLINCFSTNPLKRRNARHHIIGKIASKQGFQLYKPNTKPWMNTDFKEAVSGWSNTGYNQKAFNLYFLAKGAKTVLGDTAECGVFEGRGSYLILKGLNDPTKTHHIFDSFEGVSLPDEDLDNSKLSNVENWEKGDMAVAMETVNNNLNQFQNIQYYQGWIPEKFHLVSENKFSLVHIDVDLYQPTLDSLIFFYERMNKGGLIICDDYDSIGTPGAKKAMDEFFSDKVEEVVTLSSGQGFIFKA